MGLCLPEVMEGVTFQECDKDDGDEGEGGGYPGETDHVSDPTDVTENWTVEEKEETYLEPEGAC